MEESMVLVRKMSLGNHSNLKNLSKCQKGKLCLYIDVTDNHIFSVC